MFYQTCSCKTGDAVPGCHPACFVGASSAVALYSCAEIPTLNATPLAVVLSLGGICSCVFR
eukprot:7653693-Lingulodinium_polyedra.AAC.1